MRHLFAILTISLFIFSCQEGQNTNNDVPTFSAEEIEAESKKANDLFDTIYEELVAMSPQQQAFLGRKTNYDQWDDISETQTEKYKAFNEAKLKQVREEINRDALDAQTTLSYDLFINMTERQLAGYEFRHSDYPVNQMFGTHSSVPSFLINVHSVADYDQAVAYLNRMEGVSELFGQLIDQLKLREANNVIPPKFVFAHIIRDCENLIKGYPIEKDSDAKHAIYADFEKKVNELDIEDDKKKTLMLGAEKRMMSNIVPAYRSLIAYLKELETKATEDDGVWKFKNGDAYYAHQLNQMTTTDMTAEEIHQAGLNEVKRIHEEMKAIMKKVEFDGTLQEFFEFMRTDKQFYYPNTPEGKANYMAKATAIIDSMRTQLDKLFATKPKAEMIVKAVEPYREKSAGKAFYNSPAPDGSRPGIYYANTYNMADMPNYQMEALAYHEGIPGHHMQLSIAQELEGIPEFRKYGRFTAYIEGWGLYSEYIPKEYGFYEDPYSDFGRLAMELWRACRLVVDSGIHTKKWTRQQGIDYYKSNTPNPEGDCIKMVERHIVMPGQATAYKIGMIKIIELRDKAKEQMGDAFDIRLFHDVVLTNGAVPLDILEQLVNEYIASAG
ncbi:MAG: DUF885 domain-containing protein [Bacteroidota bacterium]